MMWWICLAVVVVLTSLAIGFVIAVKSATPAEEFYRTALRNRQWRRTK